MTTKKNLKNSKEKPLKDLSKAKTPKQNSAKSSKKRSSPVKSVPKDSIYSLDTWKWNYEDVTKPKNKVVVSLKKRVQHAWRVLRG